MKKYILILVTIFAIAQGAFAQVDKQQLLDIEKISRVIDNSMDSYQKVGKSSSDDSYKYSYKQGNDLKLTIVFQKEGDIDKYVEWYFSDGKLVFSHQTWTNSKTKAVVDDEKFYLSGGNLIAWTKSAQFVDSKSAEFKKTASEIQNYGAEMIKDAK